MISNNQITKKCSRCGEYKPLDEFYALRINPNNNKQYYQSKCKICQREIQELDDTRKKNCHKYRLKNRQKISDKQCKYAKYESDNLTDSYVKFVLSKRLKCTREQVSQFPELIEFARNLIKVKRKLKEIKQNERSKQNE